jgi:UDP-glucose 4-epimerase
MANIYGPRNLSGPIPTFYKKIKAGEKCTVADTRRDFIFIDDYIKCILKSVDMVGDTGIYHLASGGDYSIDRIHGYICDLLGERDFSEHVKRGPDDVETISLDPSKTFDTFNWEPRTHIDDGLYWTVKWYDEHGVGDTYTHLRVGR